MNERKVLFVSFQALCVGDLNDCTDYMIRKKVIDIIRQDKSLCKVVVVANTDLPADDFGCAARSVMAFLTSYTGKAVDFRFADANGEPRMLLPNVWLLEDAVRSFPALLGGKDCWALVGKTDVDRQTAENFGIDYVELKDFQNEVSYPKD